MKYPETHLGHSYGASVPSSEEMGLFKKKKEPNQQVMTAEEFRCSDRWPFLSDPWENPISFAEAYAQYYHESKSGK